MSDGERQQTGQAEDDTQSVVTRSIGPEQNDSVWERLEDQLRWYSRKSAESQHTYRWLKIGQMLAAGAIPVAAAGGAPSLVAAALGAFVLFTEGIQQLGQYHENWASYRATAEALKHEKYLYLARAGDYATALDPRSLLAERVESRVSTEHARWVAGHQQADQKTAAAAAD